MADLVIAEGVELELRPARLASRFMAALLDYLVQSSIFGVFQLVVVALNSGSGNGDALRAGTIVIIVLVAIGYPVLSETISTGRSIGKSAVGLRVVRVDGGPERFRHALTRALTGLFADLNLPLLVTIGLGQMSGLWVCLVGLPGAIAMVSSRRGQRIGDLLAGTLVVRERTEYGRGSMPMPPAPAAVAWAASASVGEVPTGLIVAGRQLISRIFELDRKAAAELADELVRQYSAYVTPAPPPGLPAYQYLVAVTGERFRREAGTAYAHAFGAAYASPMPQMPVGPNAWAHSGRRH
jgi:uncharacterized RDD family membrane protein YckC